MLLYHRLSQRNSPLYRVCFFLSLLWARILFDSGASHSFIKASCVRELGLEVEILEKPLYVSSLLGTRVIVDLLCQDCELEVSKILITLDLRVMDMLEFDVILGIDWLTTHRVVIDCDCRRVTAYTQDDILGTCNVSFGCISGPGEGRSSYELGEAEVSR